MPQVTLPDGSARDVPPGSTARQVVEQIGPGLARAAIAVNLDDDIRDLSTPIQNDCAVRFLTLKDDGNEDSLYLLRHSTAHVMAEAICDLFPEAKLVYGPPVENGFYYDIDLDRPITPDDFPEIEKRMEAIIKEDRPFTRYEMPRDEGLKKVRAENNEYKIDNAQRAEGDTLSFYVTGPEPGTCFEDLCRGPHLPSTGRIPAFKITQVSGAFWHGDATKKMLQRVYGTAWPSRKSLRQYLNKIEEAKKRDHRVLGKQLGLFTMSDLVGPGLPLWMPRGAVIRYELEQFLRAEMIKLGYQPVYTPQIGKLDLFRTSGHFPYYKDSQYPPLYEQPWAAAAEHLRDRVAAGASDDEIESLLKAILALGGGQRRLPPDSSTEQKIEHIDRWLREDDGYLVRPMNCPHHIEIYRAEPRSYRDLPLRLTEFGTVYRYEQSGELAGLLRVRGFTQDDAHLFCTPEQIEQEFRTTIELTQLVLGTLGLTDCRVRVGLGDRNSDKYVGDADAWERAEDIIRKIVRDMKLDYTEEIGQAAFYGPKVDFLVKDCIGRTWQLGTVQLDYNLPERFDLTYAGPDNRPHRPIMIHRAPFGAMERFIAILIEHFAGAFPLWLAPVQMLVASISEKSNDYATAVCDQLKEAGFRATIDVSSDKIGPKKHRARTLKIPYILVVGEQEFASSTVNVNDRQGKTLGNFPLERFIAGCRSEVENRELTRT